MENNPITVMQAMQEAVAALEAKFIASARLDASLLLADIMQVKREVLLLSQDKLLDKRAIEAFTRAINRRRSHEPVAYIIGKKEFWSLDFFVTRDTLIPRPDSETLVEAALKRVKDRARNTTILDIGTGTGCLLIALLKELPQASGVGVDINERALQVARKNAAFHDVSERAVFKKSHWCDALDGTFDLIITNPPYIAKKDSASLMQDVVGYEPHEALFAGDDGLDAYRVLAPQIAAHLASGGMGVVEVGINQAQDVMNLMRNAGLTAEAPAHDFSGVARAVIVHKNLFTI